MGAEAPWHEIAEDLEAWQNMEAEFIRRVLRRHAFPEVPLSQGWRRKPGQIDLLVEFVVNKAFYRQ